MGKRIVFFFLLFVIQSQAQTAAEVDSIIKLYPKSASSATRLADRINKDFTTQFSKARAIYTWVALNIGYDDQLFNKITDDPAFNYQGNEKQIDNSIINQVLLKRKAVCDGYSRLFDRLAKLCGLESEIILGKAKTDISDIGDISEETNHAWNSVKIDGKWRLIDVTWGSGGMNESGVSQKGFTSFYFDTPPNLFFLKHYPKGGQWQDITVNQEAFIQGPVYYPSGQNEAYQILEPKNGIINIDLNKKPKFSIANLSDDPNIDFILNGETFAVENQKTVGSNLEFEIDLSGKPAGKLTICISGNCWVEYKLIKG